MNRRWFIRYQWRNPDGCHGNPADWKSWRTFAVLPLLFNTAEAAFEYLKSLPDPFLNMRGRRHISVSVEAVLLKP